MSLLDKWNKAWDNKTLSLAKHPWQHALEGAGEGDRKILRQFHLGLIRTEAQYDQLLQAISEFGFCVETPMDFNFKEG